jgi:hypothetical protein
MNLVFLLVDGRKGLEISSMAFPVASGIPADLFFDLNPSGNSNSQNFKEYSFGYIPKSGIAG